MDILQNFGFQPILFAAQIVNFIIVFYLLKKFLYGPVLKMMDDRRHKISQGLKDAEESARLLEETTKREELILKKAQDEAKRMIDDAKLQSESIMMKTEESTRVRVEAMLREAREQIGFETAQAEKRLSSHVSRVAIQFLQEATQGLFGADEQEIVMKNALKKLKKKAD